MNDFWKTILSVTLGVTTTGFSFLPDKLYADIKLLPFLSEYWNSTVNKFCFLIAVGFVVTIVLSIWRLMRKSIRIRGIDYEIVVEYGDIFNKGNCSMVIPFDECYTTDVGNAPYQIKSTSICGQYLKKFPDTNIDELICKNTIKPLNTPSKFRQRKCYESGTLMRDGDFLLMAFGKLNSDGRAEMSRDEYLNSLQTLWKELDKYSVSSDIAIPVLGSGITRFNDCSLNQQQLVDIIIASYKVNSHKLKTTNTLRIICKKQLGFSLNKVGETL